MTTEMAKALILAGVFLIFAGVFILFRDKIPGANFLGKLPGDVSIERENFRVFLPLGTSLLLSLVLSFILWLLRRS